MVVNTRDLGPKIPPLRGLDRLLSSVHPLPLLLARAHDLSFLLLLSLLLWLLIVLLSAFFSALLQV
jgi:hypothetical protein